MQKPMILLIARILDKFRASPYVEAVFKGLRPASLAMIAAAAYYKYQKQGPDGLDLDAYANLPL